MSAQGSVRRFRPANVIRRELNLRDLFCKTLREHQKIGTQEDLEFVGAVLRKNKQCSAAEVDDLLKHFGEFYLVYAVVDAPNGLNGYLGSLVAQTLCQKNAKYLKWCAEELERCVKLQFVSSRMWFNNASGLKWKNRLPKFMQTQLLTLFLCAVRLNVPLVKDMHMYIANMMKQEWLSCITGKSDGFML